MSTKHESKEPPRHKFTADEVDFYWYRYRQDMLELKRLNAAHPVLKLPKATRILTAQNEFGSGHAVFEGRRDAWKCIEASSFLKWMKITPLDRLKVEMLKRGMTWRWDQTFDGAPLMNRGSVRPGDASSSGVRTGNEGGTTSAGSVQATSP